MGKTGTGTWKTFGVDGPALPDIVVRVETRYADCAVVPRLSGEAHKQMAVLHRCWLGFQRVGVLHTINMLIVINTGACCGSRRLLQRVHQQVRSRTLITSSLLVSIESGEWSDNVSASPRSSSHTSRPCKRRRNF